MSKILALFTNEMFKLSRKASTIVLLSVMIIACFLLPLFVKVSMSQVLAETNQDYWNNIPLEEQKTSCETRIAEIETEISAMTGGADNEPFINQLQLESESLKGKLESINLMMEKDITGPGKDGFVYSAVENISLLRSLISDLNTVPESDRDAIWADKKALYEEGIELAYTLVDTQDFKAFADFEKRFYQSNPFANLDETSNRIQIEQYDLMYKLDPSGGTDGKYDFNGISSVFSTLFEMKYELYSGVTTEDTWNGPKSSALSPQREAQLEDQITVFEYRIESGSLVLDLDSFMWLQAKSFAATFGQFVITILLLVIAGSAISQEIATGSIKSLIIAPVRRWKIFVAKLLSLLTTGVIAVIILCVFSIIGSSVVLGTEAIVPYAFISESTVLSIPYWLYDFLSLLAANISTLVYCIFAFMLSIVTRNTALSVGVSIATLFTSITAVNIVNDLPIPHQLWMDFLPFMHFNLTDDLFPFRGLMEPFGSMLYLTDIRPSLQFSIIYLIILLFCMIYIGFDSFTRRDIK